MPRTLLSRLPMFFATALLSAIFLPINSSAQTIPCGIASSLGERIYTRIIDSGKKKNLTAIYEGSRAFWDIRAFSVSCSELRKIEEELERTGMGKGAAPPTQAELAQSLLSGSDMHCPGCTLILRKPPKGNFAGMEKPDQYYQFNASGVKDGETPWKELPIEKIFINPSLKDVQILPGSLKTFKKN